MDLAKVEELQVAVLPMSYIAINSRSFAANAARSALAR
jgi:hypothetical protein